MDDQMPEDYIHDINQLQERHLNAFEPVTLEQMQEVNLMDRIDRKYLFGIDQLSGVLQEMQEEYCILTIDGSRYSRLDSFYADTSDRLFFRQHHNGKLNRFKVRFRSYRNTQLNYLETKFKNNKGRTQKLRIEQEYEKNSGFGREENRFLKNIIPVSPDDLYQQLEVNFIRLNFLHKHSAERLTIDLNLQYKSKQKSRCFPGAVIAELKQSRFQSNSRFARIMKDRFIRVTPFSKYCIGMCLMHNVKHNRFKRIITNLKKINRQHVPT